MKEKREHISEKEGEEIIINISKKYERKKKEILGLKEEGRKSETQKKKIL
jgi:hypothetical protein